jgi:hypothetical protein
VQGGQVAAAEPVGLVVDDDVARAGQPQHRVDAAGQVAAQRRRVHRLDQVGVRRERVVGGQVPAQQSGQLPQLPLTGGGHVAAGQRQLEVELRQPVRGREVRQAQAACAERA